MEESEKRRERLKVMRMEAAQAGVTSISPGMVTHGLSNPLIEGEIPAATPYASQRFDYYTDPMSAFSANKRRSQVSHQVSQQYFNTPPGPRLPNMTTSPSYPYQTMNSPSQSMFQAPGAYQSYGSLGSPSVSPSGKPQGNPPSPLGRPIGASSYSHSSNMPRGSNFTSPGFGQGGTPNFSYGQGRGHRYNSSPLYGSGRGGSPYHDSGGIKGRSFGNSTSSRSGQRGRGTGSHGSVSAELRPDLYYKHEMAEDPWKQLNPVIWKSQNVSMKTSDTPNSEKSWLQKSISMKKPRVSSEEASHKSSSQPSLAEYLAASFNKAANNEACNE